MGLQIGVPPSKNFDLTHWELTLPTGPVNNATIIGTSQLIEGYTSTYFFTGADGAMNFGRRSPVSPLRTRSIRGPSSAR